MKKKIDKLCCKVSVENLTIKDFLKSRIKSEKGLTFLEYITIAVLVLILVIGAITLLKPQIKAIVSAIASMLTGASSSTY